LILKEKKIADIICNNSTCPHHKRCIVANPKLYGKKTAYIQRPNISWSGSGFVLNCLTLDMGKYRQSLRESILDYDDHEDFSEWDNIMKEA
jgi:hypothetical protein